MVWKLRRSSPIVRSKERPQVDIRRHRIQSDVEWHEVVIPLTDLYGGDGKSEFDPKTAWGFLLNTWSPATLPRAPDANPTTCQRYEAMMAKNGKTVLLVEDNEDNRIVYSTILRHFGYEVSEALNGEEGIAKARAEKPDLILMDISIPIIDGWEATQVLKHDPVTRDIPIIALTAHALASDREKAMEVGCDGYLAKPCEPRAVVAEVQRFLGKDVTQNVR